MGPTPYYTVAAVFAFAAANWTYLDGSTALTGADLQDLTPDRFCNAVTTWAREHLTEEGWQQFETAMNTPPPGVSRRRPSAPAADEGFTAYAGAVAAGGGEQP